MIFLCEILEKLSKCKKNGSSMVLRKFRVFNLISHTYDSQKILLTPEQLLISFQLFSISFKI